MLSPSDIKEAILPTVVALSNDPIPNIRFNVAKSLETLIPLLCKEGGSPDVLTQTVKPVLEKLSQDTDVDVRFFSIRAMEDAAQKGWIQA